LRVHSAERGDGARARETGWVSSQPHFRSQENHRSNDLRSLTNLRIRPLPQARLVRGTRRAIDGAGHLDVRPEVNLAPINNDGTVSGFTGLVPETGRSAIHSTVQLYSRVGCIPPWIGYLAHENGICVGTCAFTSAPKSGVVEIAYFTFPGNEGRGVATRMASSLISLAKESAFGIVIKAHTLPEENASTRILRKLSFILEGPRVHEEDGQIWVWRFQDPQNRPNTIVGTDLCLGHFCCGAGTAPSLGRFTSTLAYTKHRWIP